MFSKANFDGIRNVQRRVDVAKENWAEGKSRVWTERMYVCCALCHYYCSAVVRNRRHWYELWVEDMGVRRFSNCRSSCRRCDGGGLLTRARSSAPLAVTENQEEEEAAGRY